MQFIAANEKLWYMLSPLSIVNYFTIPPAIVSFIWHRGWIGNDILKRMEKKKNYATCAAPSF